MESNVKPAPAGITLRQLWAIVWSYRMAIGMMVSVAVIATWIASSTMPKVYVGTATIAVNVNGDDPRAEDEAFLPRQKERVRSSRTLYPVVDRLALADLQEFQAGFPGDANAGSLRQYVMQRLSRRVSVAFGRENRYLYVSAEAADAVMAAELANAVAESFVAQQPAVDAGTVATIGVDPQTAKARVDDVQARITQYLATQPPAAAGETREVPGQDSAQALDLQRRLFEARGRRQQAELRLEGKGGNDGMVPGAQSIHSLQSQLHEKQDALAKLRPLLGPQDAQVVSFEAEIRETRARLAMAVASYQQALVDDAQAARDIEADLLRQQQQVQGQALRLRLKDGEGAKLLRELDDAQQAYQASLAGLSRTAVPRFPGNAGIVARAMPPMAPDRPQPFRNVLLALFLSSSLGVLLVVSYEMLNRRLRCREDFERDLGTPVLAEIVATGA